MMPVKKSRKVEPVVDETFFKAVFQNSMDAILITAPDGRILAANPVACEIFGKSETEIVRAGRNGLVDPSDERLPGLLEERAKNGKACGELGMIRNDGSVFTAEISSSLYLSDGGEERTVIIIRDISEKVLAKDLRVSIIELLSIFNTTSDRDDLLTSVTDYLRNKFRYEAIGIRLREGNDYPYIQSAGFPRSFVRSENSLCGHDKNGKLLLDFKGNPVLECMCGNVISGRFDASKPFFTSHGSFWTNSTSELLASTTEADRLARTRNRCNGEGYESVGLFPLRVDNKTFGLLQVNDKRKGIFSPALISFLETLADNLAIALDKYLLGEALIKNETLLRTIIDNSREGIYMLDLKTGDYSLRSPSIVQLTGFKADEIFNITAEEAFTRVHPDDRHKLVEQQRKIVKGESSLGLVEYRWKARSGEFYWFSDSRNVIHDRNGKPVALVGNIRDITDQKRMEEKLIRNELLLREAQTVAHIGNWDYDVVSDKVSWSDEMFRIFGVDPTRGAPSWVEQEPLIFHEDWGKFDHAVRDGFSKGRPYNLEFRIVKPDKSLKWARTIGNIEKDEKRNIVRLYGTVQDISGPKQVELALARAELLLRNVISNAPLTIYATDNKGIFILSEGRDLVKAGLKPGENVGVSAFDLYSTLPFFEITGKQISGKEVLNRALSGETMTLTDELNGVHFENHIAPIINEENEITGIVGVAINITERKLYELSLARSETRYRMLFDHAAVSIWEEDFSEVKEFLDQLKRDKVKDFRSYFRDNTEKTGYCASLVKITDINQTSLEFFGVKNKSELILNLQKLFTEESLVVFAEELASLAEGKKQFQSDIPIITGNGEIKYLNIRLQVIPDSNNTLSKVLVSWIDISDRINYEENLKQSSKTLRELNRYIEDARENERIGIALNLHDDLGQKLTAVKMDFSWLKNRIGVQSRLVENKLAGIFQMLDDSISTVQNISSELWPGMLSDLGLKAAVEWHLLEFTKNTGIKSTFKISPSELAVNDKLAIVLYRIIQESLTNIARHSKANRVSIKLVSDKNDIKLIIKDNGIGIDKEKQNDPKSFGLIGLKERARAYGGELKITGKKGTGTEVMAIIPLAL